MKKTELFFFVVTIFVNIVACSSFSTTTESTDSQFNFIDLTWEDTSDLSKSIVQISSETINFEDEVYVYFYFPEIKTYNKSSSNSDYQYKDIKIFPKYYTVCPVNYVSNCEEEYPYSVLDREFIYYRDIEEGGYYIFEFNIKESSYNYLDDKTYIYDLTNINIQMDNYSEELILFLKQEAKMLISENKYSDTQIPNKFK